MDDIISLLDYDSLLTIDDSISKVENIDKIPFQAKTELLKLDNKEITIYTNFVMINEEIYNLLRNNFNIFRCEYRTIHLTLNIFLISKDIIS